MRRPLSRRALALALALAGCAPSLPKALPTAAARGPYEVPGIEPRDGAGPGAVVDQGGPIPVTAADPARGDALAPVTIVEFADFQCPFCQKAYETVSALQKEYGPEKIRVVWKNYPLPFHHDARAGAELGMALLERGGSGGFWRYHDAIFSAQRGLGRALFDDSVKSAGFVPEDVTRALRSGSAAHKVSDDEQLGRRLGVTGTPTFFVNGVLVHGAQPIEKFRAVVEAQLAAARAAAAAGTPPAGIYAQLSAQSFVPPPPAPAEEAEPVDTTVYRVPVGVSPSLGNSSAPVTIVEFADFQCPFCVRAEDTLKQIATRYGDKVRLVWKNAPLPFHKRAEPAAELAVEAFTQKGDAGFWRVHDLLLAQRGDLDDADLEAVAKAAGLDVDAARRSREKRAHGAAIEEDVDLAEDVDASGTPTFFVNGRKIVGAQPFAVFQALIDEQLAAAQAALDRGVAPQKLYETLQQGAPRRAAGDGQRPRAHRREPEPRAAGRQGGRADLERLRVPLLQARRAHAGRSRGRLPRQDPRRVAQPPAAVPRPRHARGGGGDGGVRPEGRGRASGRCTTSSSTTRAAPGRSAPPWSSTPRRSGSTSPRFRAALDGHAHRADIEADMQARRGRGPHSGRRAASSTATA